jgi:hypothetical protein
MKSLQEGYCESHDCFIGNSEPTSIRDSKSPSSLKSYYKSKCIKKPIYFYSGTRIGQILHMRLRTACSSLNHHLFLKNVVDSPTIVVIKGSLKLTRIIFFIVIGSTIREIGISNQLIFLWTWQLTVYFLDHLTSINYRRYKKIKQRKWSGVWCKKCLIQSN